MDEINDWIEESNAQGASEINQFQLNVMNSMKFDDLTASEGGHSLFRFFNSWN